MKDAKRVLKSICFIERIIFTNKKGETQSKDLQSQN